MLLCTENLKSFRAPEQSMFEWRQEPRQFRDITDKDWSKVTRNQTKPLSLKRKHTRKNRHASGLNEMVVTVLLACSRLRDSGESVN